VGRPVLTKQEKRVIAFVVTAFVLGLVVKCYRDQHPVPPLAPVKPAIKLPATKR